MQRFSSASNHPELTSSVGSNDDIGDRNSKIPVIKTEDLVRRELPTKIEPIQDSIYHPG